jgi:hypothetical protein
MEEVDDAHHFGIVWRCVQEDQAMMSKVRRSSYQTGREETRASRMRLLTQQMTP